MNRPAALPNHPARATRARLLVLVAAALLLVLGGCTSSPTPDAMAPLAYAGAPAAEGHPLWLSEQGHILLGGAPELARGTLVAAVVDVDGAPVVGAVFAVLDTGEGELTWLAKLSETGARGVGGVERYLPVDDLPANATGIRILSPDALPMDAAGWFWVVRPTPGVGAAGEVAGLYRVIEGVAVLTAAADGAPSLELVAGTLGEGARLVELWPRAAVGPEPIDIALMVGAERSDDAALARDAADRIERALTLLGVHGRVHLVEVADVLDPALEGVAEARGAELAVVLGEPWRVVARPRSFLVERLEPLAPLARLGLLEHPLWLPESRDPELLARATLGLALLQGATVPIGAWLVEDVARAGASLSGSEMALRWRLTELLALARHGELAREIIARLGATAPAAAADAARYSARTAHLELVDGASPDALAAALELYDRAIAAYEALGFAPGAADARAQKATLLLAEARVDDALEAMGEAARGFAASDTPRLAARVELSAAILELARGGADAAAAQRARPLLESALAHFEAADDDAGRARVAAWLAVVAEELEVASGQLERAMALHGTGSALEPVLVLGEAARESLAGRATQARRSWLDAAARAAAGAEPQIAAIALARLVAEAGARPQSPSTLAHLEEAVLLASGLTSVDPATRAALDEVRERACVAMGTSAAPGGEAPLDAWAACYPTASALLESSVAPERSAETHDVLAALLGQLERGVALGQRQRVQRAAQQLAERIAQAMPAPTLGGADAATLLVTLAQLEATASGSARTALTVWQTTLARLERLDGAPDEVVIETRLEVARLLLAAQRPDEARALFAAVSEARAQERDVAWASAVAGAAASESAAGRGEAARALLDEALALPDLAPEVSAILSSAREGL